MNKMARMSTGPGLGMHWQCISNKSWGTAQQFACVPSHFCRSTCRKFPFVHLPLFGGGQSNHLLFLPGGKKQQLLASGAEFFSSIACPWLPPSLCHEGLVPPEIAFPSLDLLSQNRPDGFAPVGRGDRSVLFGFDTSFIRFIGCFDNAPSTART